ncbi:MAG: YmdB family metallophosphoesterase [Paracoccaceae bacterium]
MKLLFLGDVVGRTGRRAVQDHLPRLRKEWKLDFVVVNGENATAGMGLTGAHAREILEAGADCITLGDHAFDQRDMLSAIENERRLVRPLNIARAAPGKGARLFNARNGKKVLVIQVLGQVFMKKPYSDPFSALDLAFKAAPLKSVADAVVVDFHAEATSEKMGVGIWSDGRASMVAGSHTHVPTADAQILEGGTAYITDAGMCGDYDSVIGNQKVEPMRRFVTGMSKGRFSPAEGEATLCGFYVETNDRTGLAEDVCPVRIGGRLRQEGPGM